MADEPRNDNPKQPFIPREDRPEVRLQLDTPLSDLRVRDLAAILGLTVGKTPFENKSSLKDFFDKPFPEVAKDFVKESKGEKLEKNEKAEIKEKEFKPDKNESPKFEKNEKSEKPEIKEAKLEKIEGDATTGTLQSADPRIDQLVQSVAGLTRTVSALADQVAELQKKLQR